MTDNLALALRFMERFGQGDISGALDLTADDFTVQAPNGMVLGRTDYAGFFEQIRPLFSGPIRHEILGTTCEGNRVAIEAEGSAQLTKGGEYRNIYHFLFEIERGEIQRMREYCDTARTAAVLAL